MADKVTEKANLTDKVREFLAPIQGREIELNRLRKEFHIDPSSKAWDGLRVILHRLCEGEHPLLAPTGRKDGSYKVIKQVKRLSVFDSRERRPPYPLIFPRDRATSLEMWLAERIVIRGGDLILLSGVSNKGKTALVMNFMAENMDVGCSFVRNIFI